MKKIHICLPAKLLLGILLGIFVGLFVPEGVMAFLVPVKNLLGQIISFAVPLIVIGFISPSITKLGSNATRLLGIALAIAYISSIFAALLAMGAGYAFIPGLHTATSTANLRSLPADVFPLTIEPVMGVMSALTLSILIGLAAVWTGAKHLALLLDEFQKIVTALLKRIIIPILPIFISCTFACLAYEGTITQRLPVFLKAIGIIIFGQYLWIALVYLAAGIYSRKNPLDILRHYAPAYLTAIGTMSSAATLSVALQCVHRSKVIRSDMIDFGIPLFANIHLCGSVLAETFLVMVVHLLLKGQLPDLGTMLLFCALLSVFAIAAPGVPGGTAMASIGMVMSLLSLSSDGAALVLAIFALQDSFGTACNITSDGALTLMLSGYCEKHALHAQPISKFD